MVKMESKIEGYCKKVLSHETLDQIQKIKIHVQELTRVNRLAEPEDKPENEHDVKGIQ